MLPLVSPGIRLVGGLADRLDELHHADRVPLNLDWLARKLGRELEPDEVRRILESLQFGVTENGFGKFSVTVPSWRATKDIALPEDLVEEVGRMIGYDSIDPKPPLVPCAPSYDPPEREFLRARQADDGGAGLHRGLELFLYQRRRGPPLRTSVEEHVRVLNPIAAGQELLRTSLLPGIHRNIVGERETFRRIPPVRNRP